MDGRERIHPEIDLPIVRDAVAHLPSALRLLVLNAFSRFAVIPKHAFRKSLNDLLLEMIERGDPEAVLAAEQDSLVIAEARRLWRDHLAAEKAGFLNETPYLVRQLREVLTERIWEPGVRLLGRFVVLEFLGEGGMGEVYLAYDERLHDRVALKTIRKELFDVPEVRDRLVGEVQNARQVTHPNVCRIYDIYDDAATSFFAMEYLQGKTLDSVLDASKLAPKQARRVALQLAEALCAAHEKSILHRDFKPGNIILTQIEPHPRAVVTDFGLARAFGEADSENVHSLRGGTPAYMAPELFRGKPASVQTDLYAYGRVLSRLLPGNSLVARLTAEDPGRRPHSAAAVVQTLKGGSPSAIWARRGFAAAMVMSAAGLSYWRLNEPHIRLGSRQRVILNGLRGSEEAALVAIRSLLLLALGQSPLLNVLPDQTLLADLRKRGLAPRLPARIDYLRNVGSHEGARLIVDGEVRRKGDGLIMNLDLYVDSDGLAPYRVSQTVTDRRQITRLAEMAALQLRRECGESEGAIRNSYSPLERATSAVPEAVEYYFQAVEAYEQTRVEAAIALLDRAIALDGQFALAYYQRGLALSGLFQTRSGLESCARAFQLRDRTTPRERAWIESQYCNLVGDRLRALEAYKRNAFLYPDDAIFQRQLAYGYARLGQFDEALHCSRRAVDLDPFSIHNRSELIVNLAEAMRYDEAITVYQDYIAQDIGGPVPGWGAGLAHLGKQQYAEAQRLFELLGRTPEYSLWARQLGVMAPILEGDLAGASFHLEGDLAYYEAARDQYRLAERSMWLGWTNLYRDNYSGALSAARELISTEALPIYIFAWRNAGRLGAALQDQTIVDAALAALRQFESRYASIYLSASIAGVEAEWQLRTGNPAAAEKSASDAAGLFPDPLNLLTAAHYFRASGEPLKELQCLRQIEPMHGRILKHEWPGWIPLHWFELARCLVKLKRSAEARQYTVLAQQSWGRRLAGTKIGDEILALSSNVQHNRV